jgi:hypothetical protein
LRGEAEVDGVEPAAYLPAITARGTVVRRDGCRALGHADPFVAVVLEAAAVESTLVYEILAFSDHTGLPLPSAGHCFQTVSTADTNALTAFFEILTVGVTGAGVVVFRLRIGRDLGLRVRAHLGCGLRCAVGLCLR